MRSGKMLLIVTFDEATSFERPFATDINPVRAADDSPIGDNGLLVIADVMLMMRPNLRSTIPSSTSRMRSKGANILLSTALNQLSRPQS